MAIQLKLDAPAMLALFPEGSEVRLELQQAVINETVRKIVDRELSATRNHLSEQCKKVVNEALQKEGVTSKMWTGVKLTDGYLKRLQTMTADAVNTAFHQYVSEALAPMIADLDKRIKDRIKDRMDSEMTVRLNVLAKEALRGALK